ncbi:hypothetical protein [Alkalitalea saponilacus]|uniref:Uncharacterized protein n=1 Tax=Alkalitalea saponilacus TaxID=889453 RepID=A0A1T5DK21_9BACT|nr:hypothetical protein [Alkalitalea saponilacus]ASB50717.1 hypothetical protein CDL62_16960 [Alkalitalea saponilacus]SKB72065.1 hypothetical protein SAMN03080601_01132 [Alkalitalea saponilacus]
MSTIRFKEVQRFNQIWLWGVLILTGIPAHFALVYQVILNNPIGQAPVSDSLCIMFSAFHIVITIFLLIIKLDVEISSRFISYQFFPFHLKRKKYPLGQVHSAFVREYHPIKEMSALGLKLGQNSKAYNIKGYWGVQLEFRGGRQLLLGTQKPEEFDAVLKELHIPEE